MHRGELRTEEIETEVFLLPAAGHAEKDGSFTNTQRLLQWHEKAVDPPGDARSENWFIYHLWRRLKEKAKPIRVRAMPDCSRLPGTITLEGAIREPASQEVLQEINGWTVADHKAVVSGFRRFESRRFHRVRLLDLFRRFPPQAETAPNEREPKDFYGHGWGFAWPADRRILYNRASARPDGKPWSERKKLVWWDEPRKRWTGKDVPDFTATKAARLRSAARRREGDAALAGDKPFILHPDGFGWLWVPSGLKDGPLPTHYEPLESPISESHVSAAARQIPAD